MEEKDLLKKKKDELSRLCKERNMPTSGTKAVLVGRLLGKAPTVAPATKTKVKKAPYEPKKYQWSCVLGEKYIHARKNSYGNYEDPITHLVFDRETQVVLGRQVADQIVPLGPDDVKICRSLGLTFAPIKFGDHLSSKEEDIETTVERLIEESERNEDDDEETEDESND